MKKIYSLLTTAIVGFGVMMITACTEDQEIGMSLEGTWAGSMYMEMEFSGHSYKVNESEITFTGDPFRLTKGYGYWIDYYDHGNYVANHIRWTVQNQAITIRFMEDGGTVTISDFRVNNNYFEGYIYDDNGTPIKFELRKVMDESYDWDDYNYGWGYWNDDYYYYDYGYAKSAKSDDTEDFNMVESTEKPTRHVVKEGVTE